MLPLLSGDLRRGWDRTPTSGLGTGEGPLGQYAPSSVGRDLASQKKGDSDTGVWTVSGHRLDKLTEPGDRAHSVCPVTLRVLVSWGPYLLQRLQTQVVGRHVLPEERRTAPVP